MSNSTEHALTGASVRLARGALLALGASILLCMPLVAGHALAEGADSAEMPYELGDAFPALDPDYRRTSHELVLITDHGLNPRLVTLDEGQLVAWISYAKAASTIIFEKEVARSMICRSIVNFTMKEDELRSAEIHTGEFASFCQLKPGRYRYKVVRQNPKASGATASARRLEGEIIVGNTELEE